MQSPVGSLKINNHRLGSKENRGYVTPLFILHVSFVSGMSDCPLRPADTRGIISPGLTSTSVCFGKLPAH